MGWCVATAGAALLVVAWAGWMVHRGLADGDRPDDVRVALQRWTAATVLMRAENPCSHGVLVASRWRTAPLAKLARPVAAPRTVRSVRGRTNRRLTGEGTGVAGVVAGGSVGRWALEVPPGRTHLVVVVSQPDRRARRHVLRLDGAGPSGMLMAEEPARS